MVMEQAERRIAADIGGFSNITYDLVAALKAKLDEITAYEIYKRDAREAGESRAEALFDQGQRDAQETVRQLRDLLKDHLARPMAGQPGVLMNNQLHPERGGGLKPIKREDPLDDTVDDSFPASDPPSYSAGSTL